jgi:DNA polymerase-3 subunit delta'
MQDELGGSNKQGNMPAAECADILRKLHLKTFEGKYKVLILWLPEYLGKEGNRLLKLIEEPPPDTVFLFVAEDLDRILNTITSRTQILRVPRFQADELEEFLEATYELEDGMATQVAALAEGNAQQAMRLLESDSLDQEDTAFIPWLDSVIRWQILSISGWQDTFAKLGREKQKNFFRLALHEVREAYLESLAAGTGKNPEIRERAHYLNAAGWGALAEDVGKAQGYIERNANPRIVMWNLAIRTSRRIQEYQIAKASSNS